MRARIEAGLEEPAPAEPFLTGSEMNRLQSGGNRADYVHSVRCNVGGRKVYVADAAICAAQLYDDVCQVGLLIARRSVGHVFDLNGSSAAKQEIKFVKIGRIAREAGVVLQ